MELKSDVTITMQWYVPEFVHRHSVFHSVYPDDHALKLVCQIKIEMQVQKVLFIRLVHFKKKSETTTAYLQVSTPGFLMKLYIYQALVHFLALTLLFSIFLRNAVISTRNIPQIIHGFSPLDF